MEKRLYKSTKDKMIFGVCAGIADYFEVDPTIVRMVTMLIAIATGGFMVAIAYVIAGIIMPEESSTSQEPKAKAEPKEEVVVDAEEVEEEED